MTTRKIQKNDATSDKKEEKSEKKTEVPEIPLLIADFMGKLLNQEKYCDVEFIVGSADADGTSANLKKFKAHKLVLAAHSPLFETMLYGYSSQEIPITSENLIQVQMKDSNPEAFDALLKAIYTDKIEVNDDNLEQLSVVGKKYQIEKIQLACATYMEQGITVKNVCQMFESAVKLLGDDKFGFQFIRENTEDILKSDAFLKLPQKRLEVLLADDKLGTDESLLFEAVIKWGKAECKRQGIQSNLVGLKTILKDILLLIRFPTMDLGEIATSVGPSK